ncbi:hypothetical protein PS9374_06362 [Planomonospora sphaerica]|uniref:Uncharacterized protein n=1 Tax=Planomonospora sphaerica TaxID=161355 RepID=A0A171DNN8_9ACTN|nr:hypothetical protein PS9374_06362 [Planomonospora sphaerica]
MGSHPWWIVLAVTVTVLVAAVWWGLSRAAHVRRRKDT